MSEKYEYKKRKKNKESAWYAAAAEGDMETEEPSEAVAAGGAEGSGAEDLVPEGASEEEPATAAVAADDEQMAPAGAEDLAPAAAEVDMEQMSERVAMEVLETTNRYHKKDNIDKWILLPTKNM